VHMKALLSSLSALTLFLLPAVAQAKASTDVVCKDGTTDQKGRGACSGHGGVDKAATKARTDAEKKAKAAEKKAKAEEAKAAKAAKVPEKKARAEKKADAAPQMVVCKDGTTDQKGRGACSGHGGVDRKASKKGAAAAQAAPAAAQTTPSAAPATPAKPAARAAAPAGDKGPPTAKCKDGTLSYAEHHTGACSNHGGVAEWLDGSKK